MNIKINTENAPRAIGPYSQGVKCGNLIFTSGQLPIDPKSGNLKTDVKEATRQSIENIKAILEKGGSSLDDIVKVVIYLKDLGDFSIVNEVYNEYFNENLPARSCFQVARLPMDAIIEIEAVSFNQI
ncbi:RidA family protein [Clostridium paraputrificum]|uniref:RidA family protein n=1 Tax=Clostridium paraputrificum TaxID=29363 RepID=UPI00325A9C34